MIINTFLDFSYFDGATPPLDKGNATRYPLAQNDIYYYCSVTPLKMIIQKLSWDHLVMSRCGSLVEWLLDILIGQLAASWPIEMSSGHATMLNSTQKT